MKGLRARQMVSLAALALAGAATIATTQAPAHSTAEATEPLTLFSTNPVALRRVVVTISAAGSEVASAGLTIDEGMGALEPFWFSVLPTDASLTIPDRDFGSFQSVSFGPECTKGCTVSYIVVSRLTTNTWAVGADGDLSASVSARYSNAGSSAPPGTSASVAIEDLDPPILVSVLRGTGTGSVAVSPESPTAEWRGRLTIPASALGSALGRKVGGVWLTGDLHADEAFLEGTLSVGQTTLPVSLYGGEAYPIGTEWLSECVPDQDCSLPIALRLQRDPEDERAVTFEFLFDARLEYLETDTPPVDATIQITAE